MCFILSLCLLSASPVLNDRTDWNRVVAALQLVAEEYYEARELPDKEAVRLRQRELEELLDRTARLVPAAGLRAAIRTIRGHLSGDYEIGDECRALIKAILERAAVQRTPLEKPDLEKGKRLYAQACAPCHGADAKGGSPIAGTMDPPPGDLLQAGRNWNPYIMFNRMTYGGAQTAMPAFEEGLSANDRWDIAFYLFAQRWPQCQDTVPPLRADELALLGDFELSNMFKYGAAACLRRQFNPPARLPAATRRRARR
jgi:mono/diheme cytochrome c family protein